jgi:hypothetical protein
MDNRPIQKPLPLKERSPSHFRAGSFRRKESVKEACKAALEKCALNRDEVAKELSRLTGDEISIHTLNNYIAEGKNNRRMPLEYTEALVEITGDKGIVEAAFKRFTILDRPETFVYQWGVEQVEKIKRKKRERELRVKLDI